MEVILNFLFKKGGKTIKGGHNSTQQQLYYSSIKFTGFSKHIYQVGM